MSDQIGKYRVGRNDRPRALDGSRPSAETLNTQKRHLALGDSQDGQEFPLSQILQLSLTSSLSFRRLVSLICTDPESCLDWTHLLEAELSLAPKEAA